MEPLSIALALSQFIPNIVKWVTGSEKSSTNAEKIVRIAQGVTGASGLDMLPILKTSPDMVLKLQQALLDEFKLEVENEAQVNATMQSEALANHWPTYTWRPFIGFCFGAQVFLTYFVLPLFHCIVPSIPESVWITYAAVLGVASFWRGRMQADPSIPTDNRG